MAFHSRSHCDFLVIGSGLAGLNFTLEISRLRPDAQVLLVTKAGDPEDSTSRYAQGGIATVFAEDDSFASHIRDTLVAEAGLCDPKVVETCVEEGPARIRELIERGVQFTRAEGGGEFDLGREGGHSARRILHAADHTGLSVIETLLARVAELPNVEIVKNAIAIDLITDVRLQKQRNFSRSRCLGAYLLDETTGEVSTVRAGATLLATGGASKVYKYTSNPSVNSGDGIAMAFRIGARIANMEFTQFHPTCLYHPQAKSSLLSEAMRGEGAILRNAAGEAFMGKYHPLKELAPRDIVSLSIDKEMKARGDDCVYLDISHKGADFIRTHFPQATATCLKFGFDLVREPVPVVPAAHYTCGGVIANLDGETNVGGLFAAGEVAHSGLHGANRLASNSLLEALVFSHRAAARALTYAEEFAAELAQWELPPWDASFAKEGEEEIIIKHCWDEIRTFMWNYVGIVRTNRRLEYASRRVQMLKLEVHQNYWDRKVSRNLLELRNLLTVADLIVKCAQMRKESRGLHQNLDYPATDDALFRRETIL